MKELETTGKDKIQKICDVLKKETLDPAKQEAKEIIENSNIQANEIINQAKLEAKKIIENTKLLQEQEKKIFESSLDLAAKKGMDSLKQSIEKELFAPILKELVVKNCKDPQIIAKLINVIVEAIKKDGIDSELLIYVSNFINPKDVIHLLINEAALKLKEKDFVLCDIVGGVKVKIKDKQFTLDISSVAIKELMGGFVRKDFQEIIFKA